MKVKSESKAAQSCLTRSDPMDCSLPGSSVHGIFQARVLEWGAIAFPDLNAKLIQNQCCRNTQNYVDQIYGHPMGAVKLTHKMNYHSVQPEG